MHLKHSAGAASHFEIPIFILKVSVFCFLCRCQCACEDWNYWEWILGYFVPGFCAYHGGGGCIDLIGQYGYVRQSRPHFKLLWPLPSCTMLQFWGPQVYFKCLKFLIFNQIFWNFFQIWMLQKTIFTPIPGL